MADDDEIDILGDFSFNSCFAQNSQGIPSCSNKEDTVHPQWLLDSTANNWYDSLKAPSKRPKLGEVRKLSGDRTLVKANTSWNQAEKGTAKHEMIKRGKNLKKILKSCHNKSDVEIKATNQTDLEKKDTIMLKMLTTGTSTVKVPKQEKNSQHPNLELHKSKSDLITINPSEIVYENDLVVGSTELVHNVDSEVNLCQKKQGKVLKKIGNHRRKISKNNKNLCVIKNKMLSSPKRQRKNSGHSEDSLKSPKLQIVLGSGQALLVSEGEEVIKIEKKDTEQESDIEIDVDSDSEVNNAVEKKEDSTPAEETIAAPVRKLEPMPKRQKKINLDGGGGYTIVHTEAGDLYEISSEPRKERAPKKQPIELIPCRIYNADKPAPFKVYMRVSVLISMDAHAHTSRAEVMGLVGGEWLGEWLDERGSADSCVRLLHYEPVLAAAGHTHCDMDPVSQCVGRSLVEAAGLRVCGWHHSHPAWGAAPSRTDLRTQRALQLSPGAAPLLALITAQHWPTGRRASHYKCLRVEEDSFDEDAPVGYQLSVKLLPDLSAASLPAFLARLRPLLRAAPKDKYSVDMLHDVCPQAKITYLEKLISSILQHMHSADYPDDDSVVKELIQGVRDIFR